MFRPEVDTTLRRFVRAGTPRPRMPRTADVRQLTCARRDPVYSRVPAAYARAGSMTTRRLAYWWFRLVVSGRFLTNFLSSPRIRRWSALSPWQLCLPRGSDV